MLVKAWWRKTGKSARKRPQRHETDFSNPGNDKALNNQGFVV
jgi:hypothetical protein